MYINKVQLYGRLGRDPELKALPSGQSVANFSIATTRSWKNDQGEKQEQTEWHNIVVFGKRADVIAQYVKRGHLILIEGRLQTRSWESDGEKKYRTEIIVEDFQFGDNPKSDNQGSSYPSNSTDDQPAPADDGNQAVEYPEEDINPDDIPF